VSIAQETDDMLDVAYTAKEGTVHFVLFEGLSGFYSYFVNTALGEQGMLFVFLCCVAVDSPLPFVLYPGVLALSPTCLLFSCRAVSLLSPAG
jgi:hypothetical protein